MTLYTGVSDTGKASITGINDTGQVVDHYWPVSITLVLHASPVMHFQNL
jgi:hypothetical protein